MYQYKREIKNIVHTVFGECIGVCLHKRGRHDRHICWVLLSEDDGNWFVNKNGASSFWITDLEYVVNEAKAWMNRNATREKFGWKVKA